MLRSTKRDRWPRRTRFQILNGRSNRGRFSRRRPAATTCHKGAHRSYASVRSIAIEIVLVSPIVHRRDIIAISAAYGNSGLFEGDGKQGNRHPPMTFFPLFRQICDYKFDFVSAFPPNTVTIFFFFF
jgi:hypothetical protein